MSQEVEVLIEPGIRRWKRPILIAAMLLLAVCGFIYVVQPQYPLNRPNRTPGRPWSAWDAADHEVDGKLSREEMERFSKQQPHRDVEQLLPNVDDADKDHNGVVTQEEIDACGRSTSTNSISKLQTSLGFLWIVRNPRTLTTSLRNDNTGRRTNNMILRYCVVVLGTSVPGLRRC